MSCTSTARVTLVMVLIAGALVACGGGDEGDDGATGPALDETSSGTIFTTAEKTGIATYYDADGSGNCSFEPSPSAMDVVALNFPEYAKSASCGSCITVTGPSGSVTVRVVDSCPGCEAGHLDLSEQAFAKIARLEQGRVKIGYHTTACELRGNLDYHFKDGSSKWWTAVQIRNHRLPIAKVEYQKNGGWVAMTRESYNYFVDADGVGDHPDGIDLRITAATGQVVLDHVAGVEPDVTVPGKVQF